MTLNDELEMIDNKIEELESRRTDIINQMDWTILATGTDGNLIQFPSKPRLTAQRYTGAASHIW
jgi:hypothetical protein